MEKNYLHWNFVNWITVLFMAWLGMMLWHGAVKVAQNYTLDFGGGDANS